MKGKAMTSRPLNQTSLISSKMSASGQLLEWRQLKDHPGLPQGDHLLDSA